MFFFDKYLIINIFVVENGAKEVIVLNGNSVVSYNVAINGVRKGYNDLFEPTIRIFRKAVSYYVRVIDENYGLFSGLKHNNECLSVAEGLTHKTKANPSPVYDFDDRFYKMPSYFRRSVIHTAYGIVESYHKMYDRWLSNPKGNQPRLQYHHNQMSSFYYKNMFDGDCFSLKGRIKLYNGSDWVWHTIKFKGRDVSYLRRHFEEEKPSAPVLTCSCGKYGLRFTFAKKTSLPVKDIKEQTILAVDLGINSDAVCSVMDAKGTIRKRCFINDSRNKDLLLHRINRIKKFQRRHGSRNSKSRWSHLNHLNHQISGFVAKEIIILAVLYNVDVIVFEHLDFQGRKSRSARLHLWRKQEMQRIVTDRAHRCNIHVSHINPCNTSALAFDGTGPVRRNKTNQSICVFSTGKTYNCDLNASYNIGARYFIRELTKPLPETVVSELGAKVPELQFRTKTTLSTLIRMRDVLCA